MMKETHVGNGCKKCIVIISLVMILIVAVGNYNLVYNPIKQLLNGKSSFSETNETIASNYKSDALWLKKENITINGLFARITGRRIYNEVTLLQNNMLTSESLTYLEPMDMEYTIQQVLSLSHYLDDRKTPFLYIQAPHKLAKEENLLPAGTYNRKNDRADYIIDTLQESNINTLDLQLDIARTSKELEKYFYRTDHHWNPDGAMLAFSKTVSKIEEVLGGKIDKSTVDMSFWERHELKDWFIGSRGERVGPLFAGTDSLIWYTPKVDDLKMSCAIPHKDLFYSGSFTDACIRSTYLNKGKNGYYIYVGGTFPLFLN